MIFILGFISGLLLALIVISTLTYFRRVIEHKVNIIEKFIESKGPRPQGFIVEPQDEADETREKIISKNKAEGKDTFLSELQ